MSRHRTIQWISSTDGDPDALAELDQSMSEFYQRKGRRKLYDDMLASIESNPVEHGSPSDRVLSNLKANESLLEIGCGDGRLYRCLRARAHIGQYTGMDVADSLVAKNR